MIYMYLLAAGPIGTLIKVAIAMALAVAAGAGVGYCAGGHNC